MLVHVRTGTLGCQPQPRDAMHLRGRIPRFEPGQVEVTRLNPNALSTVDGPVIGLSEPSGMGRRFQGPAWPYPRLAAAGSSAVRRRAPVAKNQSM